MRVLVLLVLVVAVSGTFQEFLASLQTHNSFQQLSDGDKLLFGELVVAAEDNELKDFIDRVGLTSVLRLMDHMSSSDAAKFAAYLAEHSNYTHHAPHNQDVVTKKRQFPPEGQGHGELGNFLQNQLEYYMEHLPHQELATYQGLLQAVRHHDVTGYIDTVGYGAIFGLLEHLDSAHASEVERMIMHALSVEASTNTQPARRQQQHHTNFHNWLTDIMQVLPVSEHDMFYALQAAVSRQDVTGFINHYGYGAIFSIIEFLDHTHQDMFFYYLEHALKLEAELEAAKNPIGQPAN